MLLYVIKCRVPTPKGTGSIVKKLLPQQKRGIGRAYMRGTPLVSTSIIP